MIKIFFNSSWQAEDTKATEDLCLFFTVLKNRVSLWHKDKILPGDDRKAVLQKNLDDSEIAIHLLSNGYENEPVCVEIMDRSIVQHKKNIPVLVSTFPWELDDTLVQLKKEILPHDLVPLNRQPAKEVIYTQIVKNVNEQLPGGPKKLSFNDRWYYIVLAVISLVTGLVAAYYTDKLLDSFFIAILVFLMFVIAGLFILRKIIYPTSVTTYKF